MEGLKTIVFFMTEYIQMTWVSCAEKRQKSNSCCSGYLSATGLTPLCSAERQQGFPLS